MKDTAGHTDFEEKGSEVPTDAFLLIEGIKMLPLTQPIVNIGRGKDNHIVIDDPRVSRNHAQLRATHGGYIIFDQDSAGGVAINDVRIRHSSIQAGDIISLGGYLLVYGQNNPPVQPDLTEFILF